MTDTKIKIPTSSQTWSDYLSTFMSCPKKHFEIEGIPIQLHSPEESVTSKSPLPQKTKINTPKPDPNIPKLT